MARLLALTALLVAVPPGGPPALAAAEADYGPLQDLVGLWSVGFEYSEFKICADAHDCSAPARGCWVDTTTDFLRDTQELARPELRRSPNFFPQATYLVRMNGRIAVNGPFGHAGLYGCQVRPSRLISAEAR